MRAIESSEWLKQPELGPVVGQVNNPLNMSFTLDAVQVTALSNDPAPAAAKRTGAKK